MLRALSIYVAVVTTVIMFTVLPPVAWQIALGTVVAGAGYVGYFYLLNRSVAVREQTSRRQG